MFFYRTCDLYHISRYLYLTVAKILPLGQQKVIVLADSFTRGRDSGVNLETHPNWPLERLSVWTACTRFIIARSSDRKLRTHHNFNDPTLRIHL